MAVYTLPVGCAWPPKRFTSPFATSVSLASLIWPNHLSGRPELQAVNKRKRCFQSLKSKVWHANMFAVLKDAVSCSSWCLIQILTRSTLLNALLAIVLERPVRALVSARPLFGWQVAVRGSGADSVQQLNRLR